MAMQRLLLSDDDLSDTDIKRILAEETTFDAKKPTIGSINYKNSYIPLYNRPRPIFSQLDLSQKVIEYQKNVTKYQRIVCSSANRVCNCNVTSDVQVREIVKDHVIAISTKECVSVPKHRVVSQTESIFKNMNPTLVDQVPKSEGLCNPCHWTGPQDPRPSNSFSCYDFFSKNNGGGVSSSPFHAPYLERKYKMILPNEQVNPNSRGANQAFPYHYRKKDGGPHICTNCGEVFITVQGYVTHVSAHYESGKIEKYSKKAYKHQLDLQLALPGYGVPFEGHISKKQKIVIETEAGAKKEQTGVQMVAKKKFPCGCVVIKEKPN